MDDYSKELFLCLDGLRRLIETVDGNENIHAGIRPYGFHAGNAFALVCYPYILCKLYFERYGKQPRFTFFISINDWEQDALDGPDYKKYPFNIYPKNTSIQHMRYIDSDGSEYAMADYWQPIIEMAVKSRLKEFDFVNLHFVRNSSLKSHPVFRDFLARTIADPVTQSNIFRKHSGKDLLKSPLSYAGVICPSCKKAHGETNIVDFSYDSVSWHCFECSVNVKRLLEDFDYWWYHKPLLVARLKIFDIDITLSGGDHFSEGDYMIRKELIRWFDDSIKNPKMIFTPTLLSPVNNERMSKSQGNHQFADLNKLTDFARTFDGQDFSLPKQSVMNISDEQYKKYCRSL